MTSHLIKNKRFRAIASFAFGVISGAIFLLLGMIHNTQLEFQRSDGDFDFLYAAGVFAAWFVLVAILSYLLLTVVAIFLGKFHASSSRSSKPDTKESRKDRDRIGGA